MNALDRSGDHRPNVRLYLGIFAALLVLTGVTVLISKFHLPRPQAIALGLLVAALKASLVAAVFMHLWGENRFVHRMLYVTLFFAALLVLPLIDGRALLARLTSRMPVAEQHPAQTHAAETRAGPLGR